MKKNQEELGGIEGPGVGSVRLKEVDELAERYLHERDKRMKQTPKEVDSKKAFIAALHANEEKIGRDKEGVLRYEYEGLVFELKMTEEKLSVKKALDEEES